MISFSSVSLWRILVFPQFALFLFATWQTGRVIAFQMRNGGELLIGCTSISYLSSIPEFAIMASATFLTIGLLAFVDWTRHLYGAFSIFIAFGALQILSSDRNLPWIWLDFALIVFSALTVATSLLSFTTFRRFFSDAKEAEQGS